MNIDNGIGVREAEAFLVDYYKIESAENLGVEILGEGAWSRCFGFQHGSENLAIRFGNYVEDFHKDQHAYGYAVPGLPIPKVFDIGRAYDGHYAISTQVYGVPLESVDANQWLAVVPSVVVALEAMRIADLSASTGFGGWDKDGNATCMSWLDDLLTVTNDKPDERGYGWRKKLAKSAYGDATFIWGLDLLQQVFSDIDISAIPRCLIHGDLINRNVLAENDKISGLFDWGCSRYGDHLYDLAWFEFWSPWYPELDMQILRSALEERWHDIGYKPQEKEARLRICYLHIGLDHLAYNAFIDDEVNLVASADRMRALLCN